MKLGEKQNSSKYNSVNPSPDDLKRINKKLNFNEVDDNNNRENTPYEDIDE